MQLNDRVLARRYASALYQSAVGAKEEDKVGADLAKASRALSDKMAVFHHPRVSPADKKALLKGELGDSVSRTVLRFLELLVEKKRFGLLPAMAGDYARLCDEGRGIVHAAVRSAGPLGAVESKLLSEKLGAFLGKKVVVDVKEDPELLAGLLVRVGDWVFDGSLKGKLRALGARLAGN